MRPHLAGVGMHLHDDDALADVAVENRVMDVYGRPLCQVLNSRQLEGKDCTRISGLWLQPLGPLSLMGFAG